MRDLGVHDRSERQGKHSLTSKSKLTLVFCLGLMALYLGLFFFYNKLRFPMIWDEEHYWETTLLFSKSLVPDLESLRDYHELSTPLPFIIFGALEHFSKDGLFAGRFLNLIVSLIIILSIGVPLEGENKHRILSAVGILIVPYYLWLSSHFYTDIVAIFFVFAGFWLYSRNQHLLSSIPFVLAIACRQYMLVFPMAVAAYEFTSDLTASKAVSLRAATASILRSSYRWMPPFIAALTIFFWFWMFNGMAPRSGTAVRLMPQVQRETWAISVDASLYFLGCLGFYFVIPEWILFNRGVNLKALCTRKHVAIALVVSVLFVAFPPVVTETHGLLTKVAERLPVNSLRTALFYCLAVLTLVRFSRFNLVFWVVLLGSGLMLKAHAWDKYVLPLLVVFWYLKSIEMLDTIRRTHNGNLDYPLPLQKAQLQRSQHISTG